MRETFGKEPASEIEEEKQIQNDISIKTMWIILWFIIYE